MNFFLDVNEILWKFRNKIHHKTHHFMWHVLSGEFGLVFNLCQKFKLQSSPYHLTWWVRVYWWVEWWVRAEWCIKKIDILFPFSQSSENILEIHFDSCGEFYFLTSSLLRNNSYKYFPSLFCINFYKKPLKVLIIPISTSIGLFISSRTFYCEYFLKSAWRIPRKKLQ